jgi:hypothetical protein
VARCPSAPRPELRHGRSVGCTPKVEDACLRLRLGDSKRNARIAVDQSSQRDNFRSSCRCRACKAEDQPLMMFGRAQDNTTLLRVFIPESGRARTLSACRTFQRRRSPADLTESFQMPRICVHSEVIVNISVTVWKFAHLHLDSRTRQSLMYETDGCWPSGRTRTMRLHERVSSLRGADFLAASASSPLSSPRIKDSPPVIADTILRELAMSVLSFFGASCLVWGRRGRWLF